MNEQFIIQTKYLNAETESLEWMNKNEWKK